MAPTHVAAAAGVPLRGVHALAVLSTALISTSFPVGEAIAKGLDPAVLMLVRFILAAAILAPVVGYSHGLRFPGWASVGRYAVLSACPVAFFWCMFEALRHTSALNTSAIFTLVPGISALFGALLAGERLGGRRLAALALAMAGTLWVIFRGDPERALGLAFNKGDLIFLAGSVAMAANMPLVKRFYRNEPTEVMTLWVLITGVFWLFLLANGKVWTTEWRAVDLRVFAGIAYLALFTTTISFFLNQYCTLRIGPTRLMTYRYLVPAFVIPIDWALGHGLPPAMTYPGVAIVLLASVVVQSGAAREDIRRRTA
ncbi:MAG: DMT family transporter [Proteobacteria bacterium]|nr:DMT family transporter [Pseudomonadota bacterium]